MKKNTQHQGRVDLKAIKNSEQLINGLFKKFLHAISPKMSRRFLGTATFLALISVNLGGGGGLGSLNKVYAADIGLTDSGEIITLYDVTNGPSVGVFIDSNNHEYKVGSTTGSYTSGDTFKLTNYGITLSANDKTNLGGIYTNDRTLNFDFGTQTVSVTNEKTDAVLTWGFGYASSSPFSGTLSATSSSSISVSSSSGQAFGLVFKSAMTQGTGFAELSNAEINLSDTTIKVENSDNSGNNGEAYGFAAGNLTGNTTIKLGDIESVLAGQGNKIRGFVAGNVLESSSIELKNVTAKSNEQGKSKDVIAVELKDIQGKVTQTGTITAYGQGSAATDSAIGFSAQTIMPFTSQVTLNAVNVTEIDYGNAVGVSIVRNDGTFSVGDITVTAANNATGFKVSNSNVNNLTLKSIDATAILGNAIGLSLGDFNANTLGSAAAGTIILGDDITARSNDGGSAIGIYAGQLAGIDVSNKIFATTAATDDTTKAAYGIWTRSSGTAQSSIINIKDNASIYATATGATPASTASIRMDSTGTDVVNINAGTSSGGEWKNADSGTEKAFTLIGVETLNVTSTSYVDLSGTESLRGRASAANGVALTNVAGELKVQDSFFNTGTGTSNLTVTGTLEIVKGNDDAAKIVTFNELNGNEDTGEVKLTSADNTLRVSSGEFAGKITENGTLEKTGTGTLTLTNDTPFATTNNVVISGGTLALDRSDYDDSSLGYTFNQNLTGTDGILDVTLKNTTDKFSLGSNVGNAFEGTVSLTKGTIEFDDPSSSDTVTSLAKATLKLASDSVADVKQSNTIGGLATNGGTVKFTTTEISSTPVLTVGTLDVSGGVTIDLSGNITTAITPSSLSTQSLFDYAESQQLIAATTVSRTGTVSLIPDNDLPKTRIINDSGTVGTAIFDYSGSVKNTPTQKGVYLDYLLTEIEANTGQKVTLDASKPSATTPSLKAKLTGEGNFKFTGSSSQNVEVGNANSNYTGTTEIDGTNNFTVTTIADNAFGKTSELTVGANATVDFQNYSQTVGGLDGSGTIKLGDLTVNLATDTTFAGKLTGNGSLTKTGDGTLTLTPSKVDLEQGTINVEKGTLEFTSDSDFAKVNNIVVNGTNAVLDLKAGSKVKVFEADTENALTIKDGKARFDILSALVQDGWVNTVSPEFNIEIENGTIEFYKTGTPTAAQLNPHLSGVTTTVKTKATVNVGDGITFDPGKVQTSGDTANVTKTGTGTLRIQYGFDLDGGDIVVQAGALEINPDKDVDASLDIDANVQLNANNLTIGSDNSTVQSVKIGSLSSNSSNSTTNIHAKDSLTITKSGTYSGQFKTTTADASNVATLIIGNGNTDAIVTLDNVTPFNNATALNVQITDNSTLKLDRATQSGGYVFNQKLLAGTGTLEVGLNNKDDKFSFGNDVGDAFTGTVSLTKGTIELNDTNNKNAESLESATLKLASDSVADVQAASTIGDLTTNGGTVNFAADNTILTVDDLDIHDGITINFLSAVTGMDITTPLTKPSLFDYTAVNRQQFIAATGTVQGDDSNITFVTGGGVTSQSREIKDGGTKVGTATFDYSNPTLVTDGTENGVYINYGLTKIEADNNQIVTLDATYSNPTLPSLYAKLTGNGGFKFTGTNGQTVEVGNFDNNYTGTTEITGTNFTVNAVTDNAFGNTSELKVTDATAKVVLIGTSQTVGGLSGSGEIVLDSTYYYIDDNSYYIYPSNLTVNTTTDSTFDGQLTGDGNLRKTGAGTLTLSGNNQNYYGDIDINAGTLELTGSGSIANSYVFVYNNATFDVSKVTTNTSVRYLYSSSANTKVVLGDKELKVDQGYITGVISGTNGKLTKTGDYYYNSRLTLFGTNTYTGETTINAGTLALTGTGSIAESSKVTVAGNATFDVSNVTTTASVKDLQASATTANVVIGTEGISVAKGSFNGKITGNGGLTKSDSETPVDNTLTLSGVNEYIGATNINAGILALTGNGSIADSSGVTLVAGTTFDVTGITNKTSIQALNGNGTVALGTKELEVDQGNFAGTITGTGIFTKNTADTLTLTNNAPFTNASKIKINEGTLALDRSSENETEYTFDQQLLAGTGTLEVTLGNKTDEFKFGDNVGNEFTGTVSLTKGIIELNGTNNNADVLENATLKLASASSADVQQSSTIGDLITNGGTVQFTTTEISPNAKLTVDELDISGGVTLDLSTTITNGIVTLPLSKQSFFDYADDDEYLQQQLIAAATVTSSSNTNNIKLNPHGNAQQTRKIIDVTDEVGTAKFDYTASLKKDGTGTENGVYLGYGLTEIEAFNTKTVTLDATGSTTNRLDAQLTGAGNFVFTSQDINKKVDVGNVDSNYTGTTEITGTNFTVNAATNNAFGQTSQLTVGTNAIVDFKNYSQTVGGLNGDGKITNGNLTVDTDKGTTGNSTFDGTLNGTASLTKEGDDTLTLSGTNTYTGATTINAGTLALTGSGSIAKSSKVDVTGTFDISDVTKSASVQALEGSGSVTLGDKELSVAKGIFSGVISGNDDGKLTKTGTDQLTLTGKNTYTGETNINAGILALTGNGSISDSAKINVDGTLDIKSITNTSMHVQELTGNNNGKIEIGNKEIEIDKGTFAGTINGTNGKLTKTGTDTLTLSGTNTYTGATNIKNGTLELIGTINNTSNINVAENTTLDVKGNKTLNNLESAGTVTFDGSLTLAGNDNTTINGLDGNAQVTKTGTGTTTLANNTVKKFVQQKGIAVLTGNLTGDYEQQNTAGDFVAGTKNSSTVTINGNAQFDNNVQLNSRLNVESLTLGNNATLNVDFTQFTNPNNAIIGVEGSAVINGNAIFNLKQYVPGETSKTYDLLSATTVSGIFNDYSVTFDSQNANNRQGYKINSQDNNTILRLTAFTQNQAVTRSSGGQWSNSQWLGSDDNKFYNGDYVTLNGSGYLTMTADSNVETAGMKITSGKWTFNGNSITGNTQTGYGAESLSPDNNKGALTVTGSSTAVTFNNPITFADISVTEKAALKLPGESPVITGTLTVDKDACLTLQAAPNKVTATGDVNINGTFQFIDEYDPTENQTIEGIIKTTGGTISGNFVTDISDKLLSSAKIQIDNQNRLDLVYTTPGIEGFAARNGLSGNTARIGDLIDTQNYADSELLQQLYGIKNNEPEKFKQILFNQLGPELTADALQMNLWEPYLRIFNRLHENGTIYSYSNNNNSDDQNNTNEQNNIRGQNNARTNYEFWFEGYYRDENISQDAFAESYKSSRPGMLIGMESYLLHPFRAGMFFGYGNPRVSNEIGRVEANDLTFGIYSRSQFGTKLFLNSFLAYGNQDYEYRRNNVCSSYSGESLYASLELFHTTLRKNNSQLMPLFAIDFQKAWMDGFTTNDTAQKINKSEMDQIVLRFGMNSQFQPKEFLSFRTRLQYGVLLSGDTYGTVRTSYLSNPSESRILTGVNLGRNMFNVGAGLNIYDSKFKHSRFFADYDFDLSERATAHTGQFGLVIAW